MWIGAIISRIRWISAPRCWILENHRHHNEREKGTYQGQALSGREGALAWVAGHLGCGPCSEFGTHRTLGGPLWASASPCVPRKAVSINPHAKTLEYVLVGGGQGGKGSSGSPPPAGAHWARDTT